MDEERKAMQKHKEYYDRLGQVADAQYGIPRRCPCGASIVDEVAAKEAHDNLPGKRFFTCKEYKADGMHFRQPWVVGVEEELRKLTVRLEENEQLKWHVHDMIIEIQTLRGEVEKLTMRVADLEIVL